MREVTPIIRSILRPNVLFRDDTPYRWIRIPRLNNQASTGTISTERNAMHPAYRRSVSTIAATSNLRLTPYNERRIPRKRVNARNTTITEACWRREARSGSSTDHDRSRATNRDFSVTLAVARCYGADVT